MDRSDFRIVPKYYSTNNLTYIFYKESIIGYVEIYDDLFFLLVDKEKNRWESQKKKRKPSDINAECERVINKYIAKNLNILV